MSSDYTMHFDGASVHNVDFLLHTSPTNVILFCPKFIFLRERERETLAPSVLCSSAVHFAVQYVRAY